MDEQSKAFIRRKSNGRFNNRWFVGKGIDIGCGNDPLKTEDWSNVESITPYDKLFGSVDGQFLPEIKDDEFDFIHSSHTLEHLSNTRAALVNWLRIIKPGGFIVCTIPDEFLYELGYWPSNFNSDHKVSFTMRHIPIIPSSVNILHLLWKLDLDIEYASLLTEGWSREKFGIDQTLLGAECAIEFVARKPHPSKAL